MEKEVPVPPMGEQNVKRRKSPAVCADSLFPQRGKGMVRLRLKSILGRKNTAEKESEKGFFQQGGGKGHGFALHSASLHTKKKLLHQV